MILNKEKISNFVKSIDKKILFISAITTLLIVYYFNPLASTKLINWNRTFCLAIFSGISINKRINNLYFLFLIEIPLIYSIITFLYNILFIKRKNYKKYFFNICSILVFPITIIYLSKYNSYDMQNVNTNLLFETLISFFICLYIMGLFDKTEKFSQKHIYMCLALYIVCIISLLILLRLNTIINAIIIVSSIFLIYSLIVLNINEKYLNLSYNLICFFMYIPTIIYITREILFILNSKGIYIMKHYTIIGIFVISYIIVATIIVFLCKNKKISFTTFACVGAILSLGLAKYFSYNYQFEFEYRNYNFLYELANSTVAMDTILYGKMPIIDYFSAHALNDVWTKILYGFIYSDVNGVLISSYNGLVYIIGTLVLFFVLRKFFREDISLLIVCLFPLSINGIAELNMCFIPFLKNGIKTISICLISIITLLKILKKASWKNYFIFWVSVLICAFITYDDGIILGTSCILAYIIINIIKKDWKEISKFLVVGASVGICAIIFFAIYCLCNGISIITRIREWLSLSLGSNTTWATEIFGNPAIYQFLLIYMIIPIVTLIILINVIIEYSKEKKNKKFVGIIIVFCLSQLLYISREIVWHNLQELSGVNGVLFNFIHFTISFFVLYKLTINKKSKETKLLVWSCVFGLVIFVEYVVIIGKNISTDSILCVGAIENSKTVKLSNDMSNIFGEKRIVYSEETTEFVNSFKNIFNILLKDDETFLDFSNISSLYVLTERKRPCYVAQMPSLLTDLYSQECFLNEISEYKIPLVIMGKTEKEFIQSMSYISHNIRYYKVAEYIYKNYKPLVLNGDFAIWCEINSYEKFKEILQENNLLEQGYSLIDYGYDSEIDNNHLYKIEEIPYIWANFDEYNAINNEEICKLEIDEYGKYYFNGSSQIDKKEGNYILFECESFEQEEQYINVTLFNNENYNLNYEYYFKLLPGKNKYLLRVSQDYYWHSFNINSVLFTTENNNENILDVKILEGD